MRPGFGARGGTVRRVIADDTATVPATADPVAQRALAAQQIVTTGHHGGSSDLRGHSEVASSGGREVNR